MTAKKAPVIRPRTQRGVFGLRCRADWNIVFPPPWDVRERAGRLSCPPALLPSCPPALLPSCPPALRRRDRCDRQRTDRSGDSFTIKATSPCGLVIVRN